MNIRSAIASLTLLMAIAAPAGAQQVNAAQSEIAFTSKQMGVPVDGKFRKFDAQLAFDPKKPEVARIGFTVDLASISTGIAETEAEVVKTDWLDTKRFPQATFQSTAVRAIGPAKFEVAGTLRMKGLSQNVLVPVALAQTGSATTATGTFTIRRLDFKVGDGDWKDTSMVANDVQVRFRLVLSGVPGM